MFSDDKKYKYGQLMDADEMPKIFRKNTIDFLNNLARSIEKDAVEKTYIACYYKANDGNL